MKRAIRFGLAVLVVIASSRFAIAAECISPTAGAAQTFNVVGYPARSLDVPVNTISRGFWFQVTPRNFNEAFAAVEVVFTLPEGSPSGRFVEIVNGEVRETATPKRAVARTGVDCFGTMPFYIADSTPGEFDIRMETTVPAPFGTGIGTVRMKNVAPPAQPAILGGTIGGYSTLGFVEYAHVNSAFPRLHPVRVQPSSGSLQGIPVTFTLPSSGASAMFNDGSTEITVSSDAAGMAQMPRLTSNGTAGGFTVTASSPGYPTVAAYGLVNAAKTQSRMVYPATLPLSIPYGEGLLGELGVAFLGLPCDWAIPNTPDGRIVTRDNGVEVARQGLLFYVGSSCVDSSFNASGFVVLPGNTRFGSHVISAEYTGTQAYEPSSQQFTVEVTPHFTGAASAESGIVKVGLSRGSYQCRLSVASMSPQSGIPTAPAANAEYPHGFFTYEIDTCRYESVFMEPPPSENRQKLLLQYPQPVPAGATVWGYGPVGTNSFPQWYPLPASIDGAYVEVTLDDGGLGDQTPRGDGFLRGIVALAVPKTVHVKAEVEGLWWAGVQENGWGMSVARSGDALFNTFFVYDDSGRAQWIVMPAGTWNADFTSYTGDLYIPTGAWFGNYDASRLNVGGPVGAATLTFSSKDSATLVYTVRGASGTKTLQRQVFDTTGTIAGNFAGLWWGGAAQNGWGLSIAQQGDTLFNVWYTYDAAGHAAWYVMPGGSWITPRTYSGPLYRTRGSRWADRTYDPSQLVVERVGTMTIAFDNQNDAYLTYVIDGVEQTRSITRQPF
jgi:hypothetical protein